MQRDYLLQDANLITTGGYLPSGISAAGSFGLTGTNTGMLDTRNGAVGGFEPQRCEFVLTVPALTGTGGQLPANSGLTFAIFSSPNSDGSTPTGQGLVGGAVAYNQPELIVPQGMTGTTTGSLSLQYLFKLRNSVGRYVYAVATSITTPTNAASIAMTLSMLF